MTTWPIGWWPFPCGRRGTCNASGRRPAGTRRPTLASLAGLIALAAAADPTAMEKAVKVDDLVIGEDHGDAFMGEYVGRYTAAGGDTSPAEAEVYPTGGAAYNVVLMADPIRADDKPLRIPIPARADRDTLTFTNALWEGTVARQRLSAKSLTAQGVGFDLTFRVRLSPTLGKKPPDGGIVLLPFTAGTPPSLDAWTNPTWTPMDDGSIQVGKGDIRTKEEFGSFQAHVEFMTPLEPPNRGQGRGNSGVYLHDRYEVQVLDSFGLDSQDNDCGGVYKVAAPRVNACLPPGRWQTYDLTFQAPAFDASGKKTGNARVRLLHNGVAIHENLEIPGVTGGARGVEAPTGALRFQDHANKVRFRNVWLVPTGAQDTEDLKQLVGSLGTAGGDVIAQYALHGKALRAAQAGDPQRKAFAVRLAGELEGAWPAGTRRFLVQQLQIAGGPEQAQALGKLATDPDLGDVAVQALAAIGGSAAAEALRAALARAETAAQLRLIPALGLLRDPAAVPELARRLDSGDPATRLAALEALGSVGTPEAFEALRKSAVQGNFYERSLATAATLRMAESLLGAGKRQEAAAAYRHLWDTYAHARHIRCAALRGMAAALDVEAMDYVVAAMKDADPQIRGAAMEAGVAMPSREATQRWIRYAKAGDPAVKAETLALLGRRNDASALETVLEALNDPDARVRLAAIPVAAVLGGEQAVKPLLRFLGSDAVEDAAAMTALRAIPGKGTTQILSDALNAAAAKTRAGILRILSMRGTKENLEAILAFAGDTDLSVRTAVLKALGVLGDEKTIPHVAKLMSQGAGQEDPRPAEDALAQISARVEGKDRAEPVLAEYARAFGPVRLSMARVLGRIGTPKAMAALLSAVKDPDPDLQDAAIRVLAEHNDPAAAPYLLAIARDAQNVKHHVFALRGYIRLTGASQQTSQQKVRNLRDGLKIARRVDEKRAVLGQLGTIHSADSLRAVATFMEGPLGEEACSAAVAIAQAMHVGGYDLSDAVRSAMEKVELVSSNERLIAVATECLRRHEKPQLPDIDIARD